MNPKIMKLRGELEKNKGKISDLQGRNRELESRFVSWRTLTSSAWCVRTA